MDIKWEYLPAGCKYVYQSAFFFPKLFNGFRLIILLGEGTVYTKICSLFEFQCYFTAQIKVSLSLLPTSRA
jgi:hypothetical protein